jgi:hypothetical protein
MNTPTFGQKITPILEELEVAIIEFDSNVNCKPNYHYSALRSAGKIMLSVLMDKAWEKMEKDNLPIAERMILAEQIGSEFRQLIIKATGADSFDFYETTIVGKDWIITKN